VVGNDEVLLDAFVSIKPDKDFLSAIDNVTDAAIKRMQEKFGAAVIKGPNVVASQGNAAQQSTLEADRARADDRREAAAKRILELQKQILDLSSKAGRSQFTEASRLRAIEEERKAVDSLGKAQKEYARLLSANDASVTSDDAAIQRQILDYQKERNQAEKDYIEALREVEQAQARVDRSKRPEKSKFTDQSVADARAERDRLLSAGAGEGPIALAQKNLESEERGRAKYVETRGKEAIAVQDELTAAIQRSAEAESRRIALSAEIVTDTDQLAKARIAAEQKVAEAAERVATAQENVARQEQGAEKFAEGRAAKLITAQAALVAATEDEADAKKQLVVLNDQISASIQQQIAQTNALAAAAQAAASAQATAANPPGGNTPVGPTNPLGGGRQGGGGNPPANPPGANPPGGPNPPGLGSQFRDVRREVEDLEESLRQLNLVKAEIKTDATKKDLQLINTELRKINVILDRGSENADPFALQEALDRLPGLEQRLQRLNVDLSASRYFRKEFDQVSATAKSGIAAETLKSNTTQSQLRGISGDDRTNIITMTYAIKQQQQEVMRLSQMFDGTADSVHNLRRAYEDLQVKQSALNETQETLLQSGNRSFNTLSNNAYQAGQAIEDFAVGYSLNGLAGGIRGAANNVAFLLNDMSRLASVQKALPAGWAQQLPLIAGIGSALAIVVLPKLVEWLESLNDIEGKFIDISEELKTSFEDIEFNVKFNTDNAAFERALKSSSSVLDILKQIDDLNFDSEQKKNAIKNLFDGINQATPFEDSGMSQILGMTEQFNAAIDAQDKAVQDRLKKRLRIRDADFPVLEPVQKWADRFDRALGFESAEGQNSIMTELKQTLFTMQREINSASEAAIGGQGTSDMFVRAQKSIAEFRKSLGTNIGELDLADDKALESFNKTFAVLEDALKKSEEIAREQENIINNSFEIAFDAAARKVTELQDQLDLSRAVAINVNVDFDLDLLALDAQINEGRRILTESINAIKKAVPQTPERDAGIKTLEEEFKVRSLLSVEQLQSTNLKEREKLEERILELKEKQRQSAKFTTLEEFAKNLQINALSGNDEEARRKKRLEDAQREREQNLEDFRRIQEARGAINDGQGFGDAATRPRVPQGSAGTGFQPFFGDIMRQFTESAMNFQQPDNQQLKPEDIKQAVSDGVREGMKVLSEGFGGRAVDALKNLKGVAVAK